MSKEQVRIGGVFKVDYKCKHSVRYGPTDAASKEIFTAFYLSNKTWERLGQPEKVVVDIRVC